MRKAPWIIGMIAVTLIAAGTIYAMQSRNPDLNAVVLPNQDPASKELPRIVIPPGTAIAMRLQTGLATKTTQVGDRFEAAVSSPVVLNGETAIPEGAVVSGHVALAQQPGKPSGRGLIQLSYDQLSFDGHSYDLHLTSPVYESKSGTAKDVALLEIESGTILEASLDQPVSVRRTP